MEQLAKALRDEMERRNHSLRQAGLAMGVSQVTVRNWVNGWLSERPDTKSLRAIADYLGVSFFIILGWSGALTPEEIERLETIPGSLRELDAMALSWAERRGYLNPLPLEPLTTAV
jgi:transcriptional regulator with XRE-family HTH domain